MRPPFFIFHRLTPAVPASSPPPGPALTPPTHTDSRLPDDTSVQHSLAPRPPLRRPNQPPTHLLPRLPAPPRAPLPDRHKKAAPGTGTATLHPHPRPHHPPPEPAGKKHPLPATSSTSAPPGKAPLRTSLRPHAPARTREKLRSPPPHIRILAHLHLSPTPCSRAPPKLPLSPPRNARKNVTPHPAGRLPAPSRTSKCLPSPAGTKKAAAR